MEKFLGGRRCISKKAMYLLIWILVVPNIKITSILCNISISNVHFFCSTVLRFGNFFILQQKKSLNYVCQGTRFLKGRMITVKY